MLAELSQWRLSPRGDLIATACGGEGGPGLAPAGRGPLAGVQDRAGGEAGFGRAGRRAWARGGGSRGNRTETPGVYGVGPTARFPRFPLPAPPPLPTPAADRTHTSSRAGEGWLHR